MRKTRVVEVPPTFHELVRWRSRGTSRAWCVVGGKTAMFVRRFAAGMGKCTRRWRRPERTIQSVVLWSGRTVSLPVSFPASITVRTGLVRSPSVVITGVVGSSSPVVLQHRTPTGPSHMDACTCIGGLEGRRKRKHREPERLAAESTTGGKTRSACSV